jgi:hypothetical protein
MFSLIDVFFSLIWQTYGIISSPQNLSFPSSPKNIVFLPPILKSMFEKIKLFTKKKAVYRLVVNISYVIGTGRSCIVYCRNGRHFYCAMSLAKLLLMYQDYGFHLVHQSTMINANDVDLTIPYNCMLITMKDGKELAISLRKQAYFETLEIENWGDLGQGIYQNS